MKKKGRWKQLGPALFALAIGAFGGLVIVGCLETEEMAQNSFLEDMGVFAILLLVFCVSMYLQIIIHEAGHLIFGLLSGYRFSSFRIGNMIWKKEDGKIKRGKISIAGTGGQCLMMPPEGEDGEHPFLLYHLGGVLNNLISTMIFFCIFVLCKQGVVGYAFLIMALAGIFSALLNGIPMKNAMVNNDGKNIVMLRKYPKARKIFDLQLKMNALNEKGVRLKDMPEEYFFFPTKEEQKITACADMGVLYCNRLMDEHKFSEANEKMKELMQPEVEVSGLYRNLLTFDRIYCDLIEGKAEEVTSVRTRELEQFKKMMKQYPSILRTEYAYALIAENNEEKAKVYETIFASCAKTYPYPGDIESERELLEIAKEYGNKITKN